MLPTFVIRDGMLYQYDEKMDEKCKPRSSMSLRWAAVSGMRVAKGDSCMVYCLYCIDTVSLKRAAGQTFNQNFGDIIIIIVKYIYIV